MEPNDQHLGVSYFEIISKYDRTLLWLISGSYCISLEQLSKHDADS
jgi:hypothetical protein